MLSLPRSNYAAPSSFNHVPVIRAQNGPSIHRPPFDQILVDSQRKGFLHDALARIAPSEFGCRQLTLQSVQYCPKRDCQGALREGLAGFQG